MPSPFNLSGRLDRRQRERLRRAFVALPRCRGGSISICFRPSLHAHRGRLDSGGELGTAVHAATFLRKREIVLETELLDDARELTRILAHEVFHFAWLRLGNTLRWSFEQLIRGEIERRAWGELGWSAEWRKLALAAKDRRNRTRRWREYLCESFCDTAASFCCKAGGHPEFTLPRRFHDRRRAWFRRSGVLEELSI